MKKKLVYVKNSIFAKLVLTFMLIMIPVFILGISIYYWAVNTVKEEIAKNSSAQVSYYIENLNKEIERIKILQFDALTDNNLNDLVIKGEIIQPYERYGYMQGVFPRLQAIKNSSVYIKHVRAHVYSIGKTYTENFSEEEIDLDRYETFKKARFSKTKFFYLNNKLYLNTAFSEKVLNKQPFFAIEIELDETAIKDALSQFNSFSDEGAFLLDLDQKFTIQSADNKEILDKCKEFVTSHYNVSTVATNTITLHKRNYFVTYCYSDKLNLSLIAFMSQDRVFKPLIKYKLWASILLITSLILIALYCMYTFRLIKKPMEKLVNAFRTVENGDLSVRVEHSSSDEFKYLYGRYNAMVDNLQTLIDQVYKQKILAQNAQLKQLQAQINPHFLFNSFFILQRMVKGGEQYNAIRFCSQLGKYFRFITRSASDEVPLLKEVEHAKSYTDIQVMRFCNRISVQFDELPDKYNEILVPRLILQPFIENAFEYGLEDKVSNGLLTVKFSEFEEVLIVSIEDNGCGIQEEKLKKLQSDLYESEVAIETTGIINIHRRLQLKFSSASGVNISKSDMGGIKVAIRIDLPKGVSDDV
ncbi:sensor histidine kinase [Clostridium lacusfryxellense]|uniref:sensor histidine kinase n=1 Tax=Clostridium lacusfryxellense TaxID=205328 RepID=UPI001C0B8383|nr:histidine kinase [Clostridium lacusfryxellense]MBU3113338.1 histidine kinase [Clostridium lacusfryxellense]